MGSLVGSRLMRLTVVLGLALCAVVHVGLAQAKVTLDEPVVADAPPATETPTVVESDSPETAPTDPEAPATDVETSPTPNAGATENSGKQVGHERGKRTGQIDEPLTVDPVPTDLTTEPTTDPTTGPAPTEPLPTGDADLETSPTQTHDAVWNAGLETTTGRALGIAEQASLGQGSGPIDPAIAAAALTGTTAATAAVSQARGRVPESQPQASSAVPLLFGFESSAPSASHTGAAGSGGGGGGAPLFSAVIALALCLVIALGRVLPPTRTPLRALAIVEPSTRPG